MKTMFSPDYHHNGFVATHALGHMMYGFYIPMYIYIYIYIHIQIDRQIDRQIDTQIDTQIDPQIDRQRNTQIEDRQQLVKKYMHYEKKLKRTAKIQPETETMNYVYVFKR